MNAPIRTRAWRSICGFAAVVVLLATLGGPAQAKLKVVTGSTGDDYLIGSARSEKIVGRAGVDWLIGKAGNDRLIGGPDVNFMIGGPGKDRLTGEGVLIDDDGTPGDVLTGSKGKDLILAADGALTMVDCGGGTEDTAIVDPLDKVKRCEDVVAIDGEHMVTQDLVYLAGSSGIDNPTGTADNEVLTGLAGNDILDGGNGGNTLAGGPGEDQLTGGSSVDSLIDDDGTGGDVLTGGGVQDSIISADGAADDTVNCDATDFVIADPDDDVTGCTPITVTQRNVT